MLIFIIKTPFKYNLNQEKRQNIPLRLSPVALLESFTTIACGRGRLKKCSQNTNIKTCIS